MKQVRSRHARQQPIKVRSARERAATMTCAARNLAGRPPNGRRGYRGRQGIPRKECAASETRATEGYEADRGSL